jgi:hypothetical protein
MQFKLSVFPHIVRHDPEGYDVLHVDACRFANFSSRISHSCDANCICVMYVKNGQYTIALQALRDIQPGEELTLDYHSVTESKNEFEEAICFCGLSCCKGRYVDYVSTDSFEQVLHKKHTVSHRFLMLFESCVKTRAEVNTAALNSVGIRDSV